MATVTIYKVTCTEGYMMDEQGTGFSLEPWGRDTTYYKGYDDGGKEYLLPVGYEVGETKYDEPAIYLDGTYYCDIVRDTGGIPTLVSSRGIVPLREV